MSTAYSPKRVQRTHQNEYSVLTKTSTAYSPKRVQRTHQNEYDVLTRISTRKHNCIYAYLFL